MKEFKMSSTFELVVALLTDRFLRCGRLAAHATLSTYELQVLVELKVLLFAYEDNLALLVTVPGCTP
jgi:hypothetical protein